MTAATSGENKTFCLPFELLRDVLKRIPDHEQDVSLKLDAKTLRVELKTQSAKMNLLAMDAADFPNTGVGARRALATLFLKREQIVMILARVAPFASHDEYREVLTGVNVKFAFPEARGTDRETTLTVAAADGYKLGILTLRQVPIQFDASPLTRAGEPISITLPVRVLKELERLALGDEPLEIKLFASVSKENAINDFFISARTAFGSLAAPLLDSAYPQYEKMLPGIKSNPLDVALCLEDLTRALQTATLFNDSAVLETTTGVAVLSSHASDLGDFPA